MKDIKKITRIVILFIVLSILVVWLASMIKCEYLTHRYGDQFTTAYAQHTMIARPDYLKVLKYTDSYAEVYYVKRGAGGNILKFQREDANCEWSFAEWITVWSKGGTADDFVWPYIR